MVNDKPLHSRVTNSRIALKTLLITGFEPFGDDPGSQSLNPSAALALELHGQQIGAWQIEGQVLPCVYGASAQALKKLIRSPKPSAVICLGQAGGRAAISIERIAINWDEAALPDNAGILCTGQPILKTAPAAYFSTLPIHAMRDAVAAQDTPAEISSTAGQFVCNHVFFCLMHALKKTQVKAGFVHVPYLPAQASATGIQDMPSMTLAQMTAALRCAIEIIA